MFLGRSRVTRGVILVHGLWMTGLEMAWLGRRLEQSGYHVHRFWYASIRRGLSENTEALARFAESVPGDELHFVAHSFGGVVVHRYFMTAGSRRPGRIVALGSPLQGCWTARRVAELLPCRRLTLGKGIVEIMERGCEAWDQPRELGIVAGNLNFGLGTVLGGIPGPSDGTVGVEETRLPGATEHLVHRVNHFGLLGSPVIARQVAVFLREGRFEPQAAMQPDHGLTAAAT